MFIGCEATHSKSSRPICPNRPSRTSTFISSAGRVKGTHALAAKKVTLGLKQPLIAGLWAAQPHIVAELWDDPEFTSSGMLPRVLPCETNATPTYTPPGNGVVAPELADAHERHVISTLLPIASPLNSLKSSGLPQRLLRT